MAFDVNNLMTTIASVINKNNTITSSYNLKSSLSSNPIQAVYKTYAESTPIAKTMYPVIFIEMMNKQEEFERLSRSAYRRITCQVDLVVVTDYGMSGAPDAGRGREIGDKELFQLASNVEKLFRNYVTLSTTALGVPNAEMVTITNTDYNVRFSNDTWNSVARISLEIMTHDN